MTTETTKKIARRLRGIVMSDKMTKTIVVRVERIKIHPKYHKRYTTRKQYKVHDEQGVAHVGDKVLFEACRPLSKDKCWRLIEVVKS